MIDVPANAGSAAQAAPKDGAALRLLDPATSAPFALDPATGFLVAAPREGGEVFLVERVAGSSFELRARSSGAPLRLASTPAGPALAALPGAPDDVGPRLRFGLAKGLLALKGETGEIALSNDPAVGVGRVVLVRGGALARLAPNLVPVGLAVAPVAAPARPGAVDVPVRATPSWLPALLADPPAADPSPLPAPPALAPRDAARDGMGLPGVVLVLVRDRRGATQPGVAVRLVEDGRPVDQARTTAAGVALLRRPASRAGPPPHMRAVEVQGPKETTSIVLDPVDQALDAVQEVVVDAFPPEEELAAADDLFSKLPLHHDPALSETLLRWTDPQSAGMSSSDGPRGRLAGRRWTFSRVVPVARLGTRDPARRYLALVRQSWTHVGDAPGELSAVRSVVPGVDASERESGAGSTFPAEARRVLAPEEPLAPDAWTRGHAGARPTAEANERAHDLARAGAAALAPPGAAPPPREWTRERHEGPPSAAVANLFAWRMRSRFAVRSRVEEVLRVHALRPEPAAPLGPADLARWRRVLAPALGLSPEDPAFARLERRAAESEAAQAPVHAARIRLEGVPEGAAFDAVFSLAGGAATMRLAPGRARGVVHLALPRPTPRDALGALRVEVRPAAPSGRVATRGESDDEDVRRLAARLHARAEADAAGRARFRMERLRVETLGERALLAEHDLALPLEVPEGHEGAATLVDLPGPRRHDLHDEPVLALAAREARACAAALFHHAWLHPEARDAVGALLGIPADDPAWSGRVLGREGGAVLVGVPAARDDPAAQALLEDPGDATVVALDTGQAFTDVVLGEGEGADFQRSPSPVTLPAHAATLGGLAGLNLAGIPGLPGLPALPPLPGLGGLPPAPGLDAVDGLAGAADPLPGLGPLPALPKPRIPGLPVDAPAPLPATVPAVASQAPKTGLRRVLGGL